MQKAKLLKGTGILLSEDFPKRIKEKRSQLLKFAKEVSTSSMIFKIFCLYISYCLSCSFCVLYIFAFLFLFPVQYIYHKLLQTEYRKPGFMNGVFQLTIFLVRNVISCGFFSSSFCFLISSIKIYANAQSDNQKTVGLEDDIKAIITQI